MDYEQALEWVHSLPRLAAHPGVENTRRLLEKLGNPEKSLRFVHVAGTNGKGSATVMLASVLHRAGYRVGASVSPYVLEFRERFLLDGEMISRETLAQILTEVRAAAEGLRAEGWDSLVEFDAVTAATLLWFARERCDIVCLEVGLGGRWKTRWWPVSCASEGTTPNCWATLMRPLPGKSAVSSKTTAR